MPVATETGVYVDFKALVSFRVNHDSLRYCGFQILDKVDDSVTVVSSRIFGEAGALMHHVSNICPGALPQEVDFPNDFPIIEARIKWRRGGVASKNIGGQG